MHWVQYVHRDAQSSSPRGSRGSQSSSCRWVSGRRRFLIQSRRTRSLCIKCLCCYELCIALVRIRWHHVGHAQRAAGQKSMHPLRSRLMWGVGGEGWGGSPQTFYQTHNKPHHHHPPTRPHCGARLLYHARSGRPPPRRAASADGISVRSVGVCAPAPRVACRMRTCC